MIGFIAQSAPGLRSHFSDVWKNNLLFASPSIRRPTMVHYYNFENGVQDCSRGNTYHNRRFKASAEAHGLTVEHTDKYGWSRTSPSDALLDFILKNELTDILINRNEHNGAHVYGTGARIGTETTSPPKPNSTRKYICPCCGKSVRATKAVNIACLDCNVPMVLA